MDFSQVKKWIIPEGEVIKVINVLDSSVLWQKIQRIFKEWRGLSPLTCTPTVANNFEEVRLYGNSKQGVLPYGYTQLECTKNTDDVFIDTGILPTDNTILKVRYRQTTKLGSNYLLGSRVGSSGSIYGIGGASSGAKINSTYCGTSIVSDIIRELRVIYDVEASFINGVNTLTVIDETNNVTDTKSTTYTWSEQNTTFKFYGFNSLNCISTGTEVFEVEIIQDGVSVYHAYPCKQGETVGFYDIVGNTFTSNVNLSAGDISPTPTAPLEIESVGDKSKNLFDRNNSPLLRGYPSSSFTWVQATSSTYELSTIIKLEEGKTYTVTRKNGGNNVFRIQASSTQTLTSGQTLKDINSTGGNSVINKTFTVPTGYPYVVLYLRNTQAQSSLTDDECLEALQVEEGSTATPYEPYGTYKVPITVSGKNLFNKNSANISLGWYDATLCTVGKPLPNVISSSNYYTSEPIRVKPNESYYMVGIGGSTPAILFLDKNLNFISGFSNQGASQRMITVPNDKNICYIRVPFAVANKDIVQLEEGSTATPYQPYVEPTTTNIYINEPLRKIGEYADMLSVTKSNNLFDGKLYRANQASGTTQLISPKTEVTLPYITTTSWQGVGFVIPCKKGQPYKLSVSSSEGLFINNFFAVYENEQDIFDRTLAKQYQQVRFDNYFTPNIDGYMVVSFISQSAGEINATDIQLEEGDTATPYVPYNGASVTVVRNVGILQGEYWNNSGVGMEWKKSGSGINRYYYSNAINKRPLQSKQPFLCNIGYIDINGYVNSIVGAMSNIDTYGLAIVMPSDILDATMAKQFMIDNALLYYPLDTPTTETYSLSNTINAVEGTTIIDVDTKVPVSEIYASQWIEG